MFQNCFYPSCPAYLKVVTRLPLGFLISCFDQTMTWPSTSGAVCEQFPEKRIIEQLNGRSPAGRSDECPRLLPV